MALAYQAPTAFKQPLIHRDRISYHKFNSVGWMAQVPRRAQGVRSTRVVRMQVGDASSAPRDQSTSSCSEIEDDDGILDALTLLQQQIKVYTANEDYKMAAKVRDAIQQLEMRDPMKLLERELREAVAEQRFQDAARCRDELKVLTPPPKAAPGLAAVMTKSEVITKGVRVETRCVYVRERSHPESNHFFFAYRIRIVNEGAEAVQLLRRHWEIRDTNGRVEHVRGPGVVGTQPVLQPNTGFEYTSACPLATPRGSMEGDYEMVYPDHLERGSFQVKIAKFDLDVKDEGSL